MSSNIEIQRICEHCGNEFTARTTRTKYCSHKCNSRAYKAKQKQGKIQMSIAETQKVVALPMEQLKAKEILSVNETAILLGCSKRTAYRLIENGTIKAVNLSERMTRVKRSELDKILEAPLPQTETKPTIKDYNIADCYALSEIVRKFGISNSTLYSTIKHNRIPKFQKGKYVYVPKEMIDNILG